jgi:hypothetical protein
MRSTVASVVVALLLSFPCACLASSHDDLALDAAGLQQLEQRAEHAEAREQAFLYTELVQAYTQMAGKEMAAGNTEQANASLKRIQQFTARIHGGLAKNAKKLKDAEMMMHAATFRLKQCLRAASDEDQPAIASTIKELDKVHEELLAQVFAH